MEKLGVKVPEDQKEKLKEIAENEGYPNRSELIREMIRNFLNKRETVSKETAEKIKERKRQLEEDELTKDEIRTYKEFREEEGVKE